MKKGEKKVVSDNNIQVGDFLNLID